MMVQQTRAEELKTDIWAIEQRLRDAQTEEEAMALYRLLLVLAAWRGYGGKNSKTEG